MLTETNALLKSDPVVVSIPITGPTDIKNLNPTGLCTAPKLSLVVQDDELVKTHF